MITEDAVDGTVAPHDACQLEFNVNTALKQAHRLDDDNAQRFEQVAARRHLTEEDSRAGRTMLTSGCISKGHINALN
jgi:hypothetical protein